MGGCKLPGCTKPAHHDVRTGITHDYCGRTHASRHLAMHGENLAGFGIPATTGRTWLSPLEAPGPPLKGETPTAKSRPPVDPGSTRLIVTLHQR